MIKHCFKRVQDILSRKKKILLSESFWMLIINIQPLIYFKARYLTMTVYSDK